MLDTEMRLRIIQKVKSKFISKKQIQESLTFFQKELISKKADKKKLNQNILIVFTSSEEMKQLNQNYLNKNNATDILSFSSMEKNSLGELILSVEKIKLQAREHGLSFQEEMIYLILHGILHLLGYHHEQGGEEAKETYRIQDLLFQAWQDKFQNSART